MSIHGEYVLSVSSSSTHTFSKHIREDITLLQGLGVKDDAHMGKTVKHSSRVAIDPSKPNLRQVHLIHSELHEELRDKGFNVTSGQMGENITTKGIELLELPTGTLLLIGNNAIVEITGLRNPCKQLDDLQHGLMSAVLDQDEEGNLIRKAGVMGIVVKGGVVREGDRIEIQYPDKPYRRLERV